MKSSLFLPVDDGSKGVQKKSYPRPIGSAYTSLIFAPAANDDWWSGLPVFRLCAFCAKGTGYKADLLKK